MSPSVSRGVPSVVLARLAVVTTTVRTHTVPSVVLAHLAVATTTVRTLDLSCTQRVSRDAGAQ